MTNIYGINFEEYLEKTNDNKKNFKKRHKKNIKILKENRENIEREIKYKGFNHLFDNELTLKDVLTLINNEIDLEISRYDYIRNM
jgi:hypothetical protein